MKKEQANENKSAFFVGICKSCGEIYEARSIHEDLEGVTFQCKKLMCEGRVSLVTTAEQPRQDNLRSDDSPKRFN